MPSSTAESRAPRGLVRTTVLILGHGSRDPAANAEFEAFVGAYRAARPQLDLAHAYVELAQPSLQAALADVATRADHVVVLPLFLFASGHAKNDIPLALARARTDFPLVRFTAARPLGVHPILLDLAFERARPVLAEPGKTSLLVVGRGSSDPDANGDFFKVVRLLGEGRGLAAIVPGFAGITWPLTSDALETAARGRPERIVVLPYLLFAGRLIEKLLAQIEAFRTQTPWIRVELARHLGGDERLFPLLDERLLEAEDGEQPLPCDTCHYRQAISGVAQNVGGLKALLWSLRHSYTHTQAMPHVHAHRTLAKHVLVCANVDCADRGSVALIGALRQQIKDAGRDRDLRVTRTHCMGRCGEGPTVAVYPDGIWYRGVKEGDAEELVREHLIGDRLVSRLIDNIMQ